LIITKQTMIQIEKEYREFKEKKDERDFIKNITYYCENTQTSIHFFKKNSNIEMDAIIEKMINENNNFFNNIISQ